MRYPKVVLFALLTIGNMLAAQHDVREPAFSLTINAIRSEVVLGSDIAIAIRIGNISNDPLPLSFGHHGNVAVGFDYDIRDEDGANLKKSVRKNPLEPARPPGSTHMGEIQPGKSVDEASTLSDIYQFDKPGKYTIQVSRKEPGMPVVKSNVITVIVLQKPA